MEIAIEIMKLLDSCDKIDHTSNFEHKENTSCEVCDMKKNVEIIRNLITNKFDLESNIKNDLISLARETGITHNHLLNIINNMK